MAFFSFFVAALVIRIACQHENVGRTLEGQAGENTSLIQIMLAIRTQACEVFCLRMPRNLGVPHFRSAELLQARLEKGDLVRIGHVSPKANRTIWGFTVPPAVAASCLPAPPRLPLHGALATYPPRQRPSPLRPRVTPFSLSSGYNTL